MTTEIVTQRRVAAAMKLMKGISTEELESVGSYEQLITTVVSERDELIKLVKYMVESDEAGIAVYIKHNTSLTINTKIFAPNR